MAMHERIPYAQLPIELRAFVRVHDFIKAYALPDSGNYILWTHNQSLGKQQEKEFSADLGRLLERSEAAELAALEDHELVAPRGRRVIRSLGGVVNCVAEVAGHWSGGGGHMMVIRGYTTARGVNYVYVSDPGPPNVGSLSTIAVRKPRARPAGMESS